MEHSTSTAVVSEVESTGPVHVRLQLEGMLLSDKGENVQPHLEAQLIL